MKNEVVRARVNGELKHDVEGTGYLVKFQAGDSLAFFSNF